MHAGWGDSTPSGEDVVSSWYSEVRNYKYPPGTSTGVVGHYTQVVWAKSLRIGCGVAYCSSIKGLSWEEGGTIAICRYLPGGNYNNEAPYVSSTSNCNTCASMNYQCGTFTDNCSKTVTCNSCNASEKCINNKCVPNTCTPKTECDADYECGTQLDGCGWYIDCGSCEVGMKCNPNNHMCVNCTARTRCWYHQCGTEDDTCGGLIQCGECAKGYKCEENQCVKKKSSSKAGVAVGVTIAVIVIIAIAVFIVLFILVKKGIVHVAGIGSNKNNDLARKSEKSGADREMYEDDPPPKLPPKTKHQAPSSAPPRAPPKDAPPHAPQPQGKKPPPPPAPPRNGARPPPPPPPRR